MHWAVKGVVDVLLPKVVLPSIPAGKEAIAEFRAMDHDEDARRRYMRNLAAQRRMANARAATASAR